MTPLSPCYQAGLQAGIIARGAHGNHGPRLPWTVHARVVPWTFEERTKRELHPLDAFARLEENAARNLPPDRADAFRFLWFGLHHLAPDRDGFLLRVRVPGGRLHAWQLRGLAELTQELASGCVQINPLAGVDLQIVAVRDAPEAVRRVEALGLSTRGAGGDCLRAVMNGWNVSERAGAASVGPAAVQAGIDELGEMAARDRALADLPRGCVIRFQPADTPCDADDGNTLILQADADHPTLFHVRWDGGAGNPGAQIRREQVVRGCTKLLKLWAHEADRTSRAAATLANFCARQEPAALAALFDERPPITREAPALAVETTSAPPMRLTGRLLSAEMLTLADLATREAARVTLLSSASPLDKETTR